MRSCRILVVLLLWGAVACAEDIHRESFEGEPRQGPLVHTWGDKPTAVACNATEAASGPDGSAAACLRLEFPVEVAHNLSYWQYKLPEPVPLVPELESVSFQVKTNVPVSIKIAISPYGFIYHGFDVFRLCSKINQGAIAFIIFQHFAFHLLMVHPTLQHHVVPIEALFMSIGVRLNQSNFILGPLSTHTGIRAEHIIT